ncbi:hypothetical protein TrispH2_008581 [Trichoplax sp. H2]|nr:hypothetical protein TrispH2_008581 [Trichoplax sp. H2]|eukprot:RDD38764.1 hypothetical protein TrispH2_008581 [Trichoplax sp. H2]
MGNSSVIDNEEASFSFLSTLLQLGWYTTVVMILITHIFKLLLISVVVRLRAKTNLVIGSYCICVIVIAILYLIPLVMSKTTFENLGLICQLIKRVLYPLFSINMHYHICLLSMDRLCAVGWSSSYEEIMSKSRVVIAILCLWLFSSFVTILPVTVWLQLNHQSCQPTGNINMFNLYSAYSQIFTALLPILTAMTASIAILIIVNRSSSYRLHSTNNKAAHKANKTWKATKPILAMVIIYVLSSLPFMALQFLQQFEFISDNSVIKITTQICQMVAYFLYAVIPISMTVMNSDAMGIITSLCCRTRRYVPDSINDVINQPELATS